MTTAAGAGDAGTSYGEHQISVVVPVYRGEQHLPGLLAEIAALTEGRLSGDRNRYRVVEAVLVHDCGPDDSAAVIRGLADRYDWVRPVWLSRNFGQHAATLAGMASTAGEWIVTLDEDGQHDPADIAHLLDAAVRNRATLVYARPTNPAPHSAFRNVTSAVSKRVVNLLSDGVDASLFHSYRLILGEVGRSVAAYAGAGVYLDVALAWVAGRPSTAPVRLRSEGRRTSGYTTRALVSHFWRMVLTSGTKALRLVSALGIGFAVLGFLLAAWIVVGKLVGHEVVQGWSSLMVVTLVSTGIVLLGVGIVAEYVGVAVNMAMGKPLYLITSDPARGPLHRRAPDAP